MKVTGRGERRSSSLSWSSRIEAGEERLGRVEALDSVVLALEQPLERISDGFVVVDDIDGAALGDEAHAVAAAGAV
jgi:hypothetical protein